MASTPRIRLFVGQRKEAIESMQEVIAAEGIALKQKCPHSIRHDPLTSFRRILPASTSATADAVGGLSSRDSHGIEPVRG